MKRYFSRWGEATERGEHYDAHPERIKEGYRSSIIQALNRTLVNKNIPTPNGEIPADIMRRINEMSLEQLANFFGEEVDEELENNSFDSDNIQEGDLDSFENYVNSQISWVQRVYPNNNSKNK